MNFQTLYPKEINMKRKEENALLIDIRTREEFIDGHWPGAVSYPYEESPRWGQKLNRNRTMILYCDHGGTSMLAARELGRLGYKIYTVIGGYERMKKIQENYFKFNDFV